VLNTITGDIADLPVALIGLQVVWLIPLFLVIWLICHPQFILLGADGTNTITGDIADYPVDFII